MKKLFIVLIVVLLFSGCSEVHPLQENLISDEPYGFFGGLIHGFVSILAFIGNLFGCDFAIYNVDNNGNLYDFGFLVGIGAFSKVTYK